MHSELINPNLTRLPKMELLGIPVLLATDRISRQTVHFDLHIYELQGQPGEKFTLFLVSDAGEAFMGTLISAIPLLPEGVDFLPINRADFEMEPDASMTVSEFEARYGA